MARTKKAELEIERLLWRAGFGPRPGDVKRLARKGRQAAVEELLRPRGARWAGPEAKVDGAPLDPLNVYGHDVLWWFDKCVRTRQPLAERMALNWHDHFATSNQKVGDVQLMVKHYYTLRTHALGNFRKLALAMLNDGAMQLWLDLAGSDKNSPNENFARELMELFTLGVNNGYTEKDIREAARALTGYTFDYDTKSFGYDADRHDTDFKRIFGKRGRFTAIDVVNMAVEHPNHPKYLCSKLWSYFTPRPVPPATLRQMIRAYKASKYEIKPVLRIILNHPTLYADLDAPDQVKPPVVFAAGILRRLNRGITYGDWTYQLDEMGQQPFYPPNVAGWDQDASWLSPATIRARFDVVSKVLDKDIKDGSIDKTETVDQALASAIAATGRPQISPRTRTAMKRYAAAAVAGRTDDWEVKHYFPERQRVLRHLLLAGPDAQVC
ncbi:MAG: DUF1800 domain-containing protein [Thermoleophilia bacterium]